MRLTTVLGLVAAAGLTYAGIRRIARRPLRPVRNLDLQRFLGTWYEIARLPRRYERGCVGATATYSLRPDGTIDVLNQCFRGGALDAVRGKAWRPNPSQPGKLKVSFGALRRGDYNVLAIDPDYRFALVGSRSRRGAWILSRTPYVPWEIREDLEEELRHQGFDPSAMVDTPHV